MTGGPEPAPGRERILQLALFCLLTAVVAVTFLTRFVLVELAVRRLFFPAAVAGAEMIAIAVAGALAYRWLSRSGNDEPPSFATAFLLGYPLFGTACFLIALFFAHRSIYLVFMLLLLALAPRVLRPVFRSVDRDESLHLSSALTASLLGIAALLALLCAQLPPSTLDELAYHLAVPKLWALEGRAVELPLLSHSWFPLGIESADLPLLTILGDDGAIASHLLHLFAAIATAALIFGWIREKVGSGPALIGTLAIVSTPALLTTAGFSWNDWPLLGITVALFIALERDSGAAPIAIAAGLLTKYTFLPIAAIAVLLARRRGTMLVGALAGSVFYVRNLVLTGNPVAPFLTAEAPSVAGYRRGISLFDTLNGYLFDPLFIDEALGITLVMLVLAVILARRNLFVLLLLGVGVVALFFAPSSRILIPFLVVPAIYGYAALPRNAWVSGLIAAAAVCQLLLGGYYVSTLEPFAILGGRVSDEEYLQAHRGGFGDIQMVNAALPAGSRTLVVGMNELFWFARPVRGGGNFDGPRVNAYLESGDLAARLKGDGFTHLAVFNQAPRRGGVKEKERTTELSARALSNISRLQGDRVASSPGAILIRLP
jgi:hypothetical protein